MTNNTNFSPASAAPIEVEGGMVEGTIEDNLTVYRGIPFAAPPVGDLRWQPPQPPKKWEGVLKADKFAPGCYQNRAANAMSGVPEIEVSEDCLHLNVWTPAKSADDNLPVMVWIHGGGFMSGATLIPLYSGEELAKKGVVMVSIAYRFGPLGFLAHPGLSASSDNKVSGNYGILDQIEALKWLQRNIKAFGGNPDKVTIFGESVGGISTSILSASPLAAGLFHGAISQSGGSFGPTRTPPEPGENLQSLVNAERVGEEFAKKLGAESAEDLRKLSPDKILEGAHMQRGISWPIVDGWVIPDDQYKLYEAGKYNDVPVLIGTNSDEGAFLSMPVKAESYLANIKKRFGPFADRILKYYPGDDDATAKKGNGDLFRDAGFAWHTLSWARLQTKTGKSKVFSYFFDHAPPYPPDSPFAGAGAVHASEIMYVFKHLDQRPLRWRPEDREISEAMAAYWTNFAKTGDPNGEGLPEWPAYADGKPTVMHFKDKSFPGPVENMAQMDLLDEYFAWRRSPEGENV